MTDAELLEIARQALPTRLQTASMKVLRASSPALLALKSKAEQDEDKQLREELEVILKFKLPASEPSEVTEVVAVETTPFGTRATVVHIRDGVALRVISQA